MLQHSSHPAPYECVMVHGAGGNNLLWNRSLARLSGPALATAVNLPGHPSGEITCKSIDDYSEALHDHLVSSGAKAPVVCGHSMGSAVALRLVLDHPGDVGGLVLVGGGAKMGVDPALLEGLRGKPMGAIEKLITPMSFYSLDLGLGREARAALSVSNLPVFLNDYLACQGFDVRVELPSISVTTLIVCGDRDRMTPPKWSHYLNANILGSELVFVRDSGHMLPLERPEALASILQPFLARFSR